MNVGKEEFVYEINRRLYLRQLRKELARVEEAIPDNVVTHYTSESYKRMLQKTARKRAKNL